MVCLPNSNQKGLHSDSPRTISCLPALHRLLLTVNNASLDFLFSTFFPDMASSFNVSVSTVCVQGVVMEDPYWQSFMEQAVRLIYFLAESPDQLCSRLLQRSARLLLDQIAEGGEVNKDVGQIHDASQDSGDQEEQG